MRKFLALAAASAALLAGCAASEDMAAAPPAADMTPEAALPFVQMAGASDLYEIQSSQIATSKAQRPEVRQFAQMLIEHHTMTTQQVTAAARSAGLNPPPPQLMPMQADMIEKLNQASGSDFDRVYLAQQIPAHEMALALHSNYAEDGDTPSLRTAAQGAVPVVQGHLERARQLSGR